jgi:hypothetical protein
MPDYVNTRWQFIDIMDPERYSWGNIQLNKLVGTYTGARILPQAAEKTTADLPAM